MNEEDYEVDENKKPVIFRQRIFPKEEEVGVCAGGVPHNPRSETTVSIPGSSVEREATVVNVSNNLTDCVPHNC